MGSSFHAEPNGQTFELRLRHIRTRIVTGADGHLWEELILPQRSPKPRQPPRNTMCFESTVGPYPVSYSLPFRTLYRALLPTLGRSANAVATVSRFSAGQPINYCIGSERQDGVKNAARCIQMYCGSGRRSASGHRDLSGASHECYLLGVRILSISGAAPYLFGLPLNLVTSEIPTAAFPKPVKRRIAFRESDVQR